MSKEWVRVSSSLCFFYVGYLEGLQKGFQIIVMARVIFYEDIYIFMKWPFSKTVAYVKAVACFLHGMIQRLLEKARKIQCHKNICNKTLPFFFLRLFVNVPSYVTTNQIPFSRIFLFPYISFPILVVVWVAVKEILDI